MIIGWGKRIVDTDIKNKTKTETLSFVLKKNIFFFYPEPCLLVSEEILGLLVIKFYLQALWLRN